MESRKKSGVGWAVFIVIVAVAFAAYSAINMQQMEQQIQELQTQNEQLKSKNNNFRVENDDYEYEYTQLYQKHQSLVDSIGDFLDEMEESPLYDKYEEIQNWWMMLSIDLSYYD